MLPAAAAFNALHAQPLPLAAAKQSNGTAAAVYAPARQPAVPHSLSTPAASVVLLP